MKNYMNYFTSFQTTCHEITEIIPYLFLGSQLQFNKAIKDKKQIDVAVALDSVSPEIWNSTSPEKLEIIYFPIHDFGTAKTAHLRWLVDKIIEKIQEEKKVFLFCIGGHGRTGYVASCVLAALGIKDPIGFLKKHYCENTVESYGQAESIADFMLKSGKNPTYVYKWCDIIKEEERKRVEKYLKTVKSKRFQ